MNSLVELVVVIAIIGLLGASQFAFNLTPYTESWAATSVLQHLFSLRMLALANDQTRVITPQTLSPLLEPAHLNSQWTVSNLGFTSNGTTNKAGTITIATRPYIITLGVGYGQPRLR